MKIFLDKTWQSYFMVVRKVTAAEIRADIDCRFFAFCLGTIANGGRKIVISIFQEQA